VIEISLRLLRLAQPGRDQADIPIQISDGRIHLYHGDTKRTHEALYHKAWAEGVQAEGLKKVRSSRTVVQGPNLQPEPLQPTAFSLFNTYADSAPEDSTALSLSPST
jgi:hypothetical protein